MKTFPLRKVTLMLALVAVLGLSGVASAHGGNDGRGNGRMGGHDITAGLTPEKQAAVQKLQADHLAATAPLRQQLIAKKSELNAQLYSNTPDDKKIQALTKEVCDLSNKLFEAKVNLRKQLVKEGVLASGGMGKKGKGADL